MVSDADIVRRLAGILRKADLATTTTAAIRKQLERDLGVDLTDRKAFIREQVDLFFKEQREEEEEEEEAAAAAEEQSHEGELPNEETGENEDQPQEEEEEEEDGEDEAKQSAKASRRAAHEPESKRFRAKIDRAIKASLPKETKKRGGGGGGLNKVCGLSPELQAIIGQSELPRTQVVKQLWVYIRQNQLQDPDNRRKIVCNEELHRLFGVESTDIFKMNKLLSKHIWPLDGETRAKKPKTDEAANERRKAEKEAKKEAKKKEIAKARISPSTPQPLSDALVEFLGTDETEMAQHEVVKQIWEYIAENKLQEPALVPTFPYYMIMGYSSEAREKVYQSLSIGDPHVSRAHGLTVRLRRDPLES